MDNKTIRSYYDYMLPFYKLFWYKGSESNALHYGLWDKDTKNLEEALLNTNKFMADKVNLTSNDKVLDAGCGIGGSSIWIASNYKAKVVGVTLSPKQVKKAKQLAEANTVDEPVQFYARDYLNTKFEDNSFDVIWVIESVCHANNKIDFLEEAYRLLRKGGRLIIADGFLIRNIKNNEEQKIIDDFTLGFALPNITTVKDFEADMKRVGFRDITFWNKTIEVSPSSKRMYRMGRFSYPIVKVMEKLNLTSKILTLNIRAIIVQYDGVRLGLGGYGFFYGEK